MTWFEPIAAALYVAGLIGCAALVWMLASGRFDRAQAVQGGMALCLAALIAGLFLASWAIPDWNLFAVLAAYVPYFGVSVWSFYFAQLLARDRDLPFARQRALLWTIPSLLLAPLAVGLLFFLLPPR